VHLHLQHGCIVETHLVSSCPQLSRTKPRPGASEFQRCPRPCLRNAERAGLNLPDKQGPHESNDKLTKGSVLLRGDHGPRAVNRSKDAQAARRRPARPLSETGIGAGRAIRPAEAAQVVKVKVNPAVLGDADVRVDLAVRAVACSLPFRWDVLDRTTKVGRRLEYGRNVRLPDWGHDDLDPSQVC
jgi:hypothetical protein